MHDLHVTGRSTFGWYYLYNCMLWDCYNNSWLWLSTWNVILSYLSFETLCFRYGSFKLNLILLVSAEFISVCFFAWVRFTLSFIGEFAVLKLFDRNIGMNLRLVLGTWNLHWNLNFRLGTWTGTHISADMVKTCSFITAKFVSNY